jgi:hypothetical protein
MNFEPPPSDMANEVPQRRTAPATYPKSLLELQLSTNIRAVAGGAFPGPAGQELAPRVSDKPQFAEIAQIAEQFLIACNFSCGQEIGHSVKK